MSTRSYLAHAHTIPRCLTALRRIGAEAVGVRLPSQEDRNPIIEIDARRAPPKSLRGAMTKRAYNGILTTEIHACLYHGCQVQWQTRGGS